MIFLNSLSLRNVTSNSNDHFLEMYAKVKKDTEVETSEEGNTHTGLVRTMDRGNIS